MIQGTGLHPHEYFMRGDHRVRGVLIPQDLRPSMLVKSDCFHDFSSQKSLESRDVITLGTLNALVHINPFARPPSTWMVVPVI
jgi:hypothetical protein